VERRTGDTAKLIFRQVFPTRYKASPRRQGCRAQPRREPCIYQLKEPAP
jgi:hypothetical protein